MMKADLNFVSRAQFDAWIAEQKSAYSPEFKKAVEPTASLRGASSLYSAERLIAAQADLGFEN